jgi:DNA-binding XRE family transcriptional regulator
LAKNQQKKGGYIMAMSIKAIRVNNDLSQKEFADKIDMPVSTFKLKEQGKSPWLFEEIVKISKLFNIDVKDIKTNN